MMRRMRIGGGLLGLAVLALAGAGCADFHEATHYPYPAFYRSFSHLGFSVKNIGETPRVTDRDLDRAGDQQWWGDPVVINPKQVVQAAP